MTIHPSIYLSISLSIYLSNCLCACAWTCFFSPIRRGEAAFLPLPGFWSITAISHPPWSYPRDEDTHRTTTFRSSLVCLFHSAARVLPPSSGIQIHFQHNNIRKQAHNELFWGLWVATPRQLAVYLPGEVCRRTQIVYLVAECHVRALWNFPSPHPPA